MAQYNQSLLLSNIEPYQFYDNTTEEETEVLELLNFSDSPLELGLVNYTKKGLSWGFNLWLDENSTSENNTMVWSEFLNVDAQLSYGLKNWDFVIKVTNLFKMNNADFDIEPSLDGFNNIVRAVQFDHVAIHQIAIAMVYTF